MCLRKFFCYLIKCHFAHFVLACKHAIYKSVTTSRLSAREDSFNGFSLQAEDVSSYPQCLLKMGRFRGTRITGDILHNRQERVNVFVMMREGIVFPDRIFPLA